MKTITILNIHSFVDLITNSSSELFVCDTRKSIDAVKLIIEKIISNYYQEQEQDVPNIWGDIFSEPYIINQDFDLSTYPNQEDINKQDYNFYKEKEREINHKINLRYPEPVSIQGLKWEARSKHPDSIKWSENTYKLRMALSQPLWDERDAARKRIEKYFKNIDPYFISYGITCKKGNIVLRSASDNSVPYECWDRINSILNARNYHLG